MTIRARYLMEIVGGGLLFVCSGCGGAESSASTATTADSVLDQAEQDLSDVDDSLGDARELAAACFDGFESCVADAGSDEASCRRELETCLPARPPAPPRCAPGDGDGEGGMLRPPPRDGEDGMRPPPRDGEDGMRPPPRDGEDGMRPPPPDGEDGRRPPPPDGEDGGCAHAEDGDGGRPSDAPRPPRRGHCGPPPVALEKLAECREQAQASLEVAEDPADVRAAHGACVRDAFEEHRQALCTAASERCASSDADAVRCDTILARCAEEPAP